MFRDLAITFVSMTCDVLNLIVFFDVILTWIAPPDNRVFQFVDTFARPLLNTVRRVIPPIGMIDLSPIIVLFGLEMIKNILVAILSGL
jgi:YggT family protein